MLSRLRGPRWTIVADMSDNAVTMSPGTRADECPWRSDKDLAIPMAIR